MRSTFKLLFYINRNKVKSDGTTAVLCRISIDGKKSAVTTGVYCKPGDWDSKKCEIKTARENNRLAAFRSRLEEAYGNLLRNQGVVTAELLKTTVSGANSVPEYLLQAGEVERERLRVRSKEINSTSTYRQSKTTQLNLRQFIESRGMKDIAFSDITEEFAESFKVFLKKELGHRNGHVNHCLCWLNRLIYIGRKLQAGFDGDGTGTETDVPEDAAAVQFQCLQGEQADGSLGYHAGASVKMCKLFIGDAEGTDWKVRGLYAAVQGVCAALSGMAVQQQAVGMFEVAGNRFPGCHPAYAFLFGIAEMLADV